MIKLMISLFFVSQLAYANVNFNYLIRHPNILQKQYTERADTLIPTAECKEIIDIAADFAQLLNDEIKGPEKFGQDIMQLEYQMSLQKELIKNLEKETKDTQSLSKLIVAKKELQDMQKN